MTVAIVVQLSPADVLSPYARALLDTCNIGMRSRARCVLEQNAAANDQSIAVAILTWDGPSRSQARIEVGLRIHATPQWQNRVLSFSSEDPEAERWRTAGFAIATLVGEAVARNEAESKRAETETASRREAPGPTFVSSATSSASEASETVPARSWLDAQFLIAGGAPGFWPAQGGEMRFSTIPGGDRWFVTGGVQCTVQQTKPDSISIVRPGASVGGGVVVLRLGSRFRVALRADAILQLIGVTGTDSVTGASGSGGRWVGGLAQGADLSWMWSQSLGVTAGAAMSEATGQTEIRTHGQLVARIPALDFAAQGGLRFPFR